MYKKLQSLIKGQVHQYQMIDTNSISFSLEVRKSCMQNHCGMYKKNWMCPPAVGEVSELREKYCQYQQALVFTKLYMLEDSYDQDGMDRGLKDIKSFIDDLKEALIGLDYKILGAGSCTICSECTYPVFLCKNPQLAMPSLEAVGIDVVDLANKCQINYYNGKNTVTYFAAIFFN